MLPCVAEFMQPGAPHPSPAPRVVGMQQQPIAATMVLQEPVPLSPAPSNLQIARPSKPWQMYGRIVWIVWWLFWFEMFFFEGWAYSIFDDALLGALGFVCAIPCLLLALAIRRPRVVLLERAVPDSRGTQLHVITTNNGSLQTPMPTRFDRHLIRDDSVLDVPSTLSSWGVFALTIICSIGLWSLIILGNDVVLILASLSLFPVIIVGFSIPVMAWWSHSTKRIGLPTRRRDAENWLMAGILSAIHALFINSIFFPELVLLIMPEISIEGLNNLGAVISAPVGEEICKGLSILFFASKIKSPKHGFQIGFTVGLGFAILENLMYVGGTAGSQVTIFIRGIGSIPGHATWTAISGYAIGKYVINKRWHIRSLGVFDKSKTQKESQWILFDGKSGQPIISSKTQKLPHLPKWLSAGQEKMVKITSNPIKAVAIAIFFHAIWKGSLWSVGVLLKDTSVMIQILANLLLIIVLIILLWIVLRRLIPFALLENSNQQQ